MVNELRTLLHESSDDAPYDAFDATSVVRAGRSRHRRRRAVVVGAAGLAAGAVIGSTVVLSGLVSDQPDPASPSSSGPVGPVVRLDDASPVSLTPALEAPNGYDDSSVRYLDGVTDGSQVIVRDDNRGQDADSLMLVDLESGAEQPLPDLPERATRLLEATTDRLVYSAERTSNGDVRRTEARVLVLDQGGTSWRELLWPELPTGALLGQDIGPDGRLYVAVGEAQVGAPDPAGTTSRLFSVSLTDATDVRDEDLDVGSFAIDGDHLVWSDVASGMSNELTVRDLQTGEQTSFDPQSGNCIQTSLDVDLDRIVMFQNCVTLNGVRDDRIQIVSLDGEPVVTVQDASIRGHVDGGGHVVITADQPGLRGVYSYDLETGDLTRLSTTIPSLRVAPDGPVGEAWLMWTEGQGQDGWVQKVVPLP